MTENFGLGEFGLGLGQFGLVFGHRLITPGANGTTTHGARQCGTTVGRGEKLEYQEELLMPSR
jgi:hypothetical protein